MTKKIKKNKKEQYKLLADCIRSDQLSARQVYEHLEIDPQFKRWYLKTYCNTPHFKYE
jgi:hypothetical protein